eukprot:SAG11_NODE_61_length_19011_cov_49.624048_14_plen_168_part_00
MVAVVCVGIPLVAAVSMLAKARSTDAASANVVAALIQEWKIEKREALDAVRAIEVGRDYGYLLAAFRPSCFAWEPLDMTRKLLMVGIIVVVGRGTAGQLLIAIFLAGGFCAMHLRNWPYKQVADNALKMTSNVSIVLPLHAIELYAMLEIVVNDSVHLILSARHVLY